MQGPIRVLVLGTGQMGSSIARLVLRKEGLDLVAAYGRRIERAGMDLGQAIGLDRDLGLRISGVLPPLIDRARPHVAIQATCSRLADAIDEISTLVRHGVHVITIAEEMAYPFHSSPTAARELHRLAVDHGAAVIGTGVNPGFVLDVLVITLTAVCSDIQSLAVERINDLSAFGPAVLESQGVGLTPEQFRRGLEDGSVVGHVGFPQSIHMIAAALGWEVERIEESREPIVSRVRRETPRFNVGPGHVAGCRHTAVAYREGRPVISLVHPQQVLPELESVKTGDTIEIRGNPDVRFAGSPEIPGGQGTSSLAVNMIPRILNAAPGLHSMTDLPVPSAMLADARRSIDRTFRGNRLD